jgi:hypothetical protein
MIDIQLYLVHVENGLKILLSDLGYQDPPVFSAGPGPIALSDSKSERAPFFVYFRMAKCLS